MIAHLDPALCIDRVYWEGSLIEKVVSYSVLIGYVDVRRVLVECVFVIPADWPSHHAGLSIPRWEDLRCNKPTCEQTQEPEQGWLSVSKKEQSNENGKGVQLTHHSALLPLVSVSRFTSAPSSAHNTVTTWKQKRMGSELDMVCLVQGKEFSPLIFLLLRHNRVLSDHPCSCHWHQFPNLQQPSVTTPDRQKLRQFEIFQHGVVSQVDFVCTFHRVRAMRLWKRILCSLHETFSSHWLWACHWKKYPGSRLNLKTDCPIRVSTCLYHSCYALVPATTHAKNCVFRHTYRTGLIKHTDFSHGQKVMRTTNTGRQQQTAARE